MATGANVAFGTGANADTWKTGIDLSTLDGTDDYWIISNDNALNETIMAAGDVFGKKQSVAAAGAVTATIDVYGCLIPA